MLKVGLTGGIASGKSTVAGVLASHGAAVIDSDEITHQLLEPGQGVYESVVDEFGPGILAADGKIDRKALGAIVFRNPDRREVLNGLVHPAIAERQQEFIERVRARDPHGVAVVDAALIIETGTYRKYDCVIVVSCTLSQQRERLRARGLTASEIETRIGSQMSLEEKIRVADYVIDNSGLLEHTRRQVARVWEELERRAKAISSQ